jgi:hypothetical protein
MEAEQHAVAGEHVPNFMGPRRPPRTDYPERFNPRAMLARPLIQEIADTLVKMLIPGNQRLGQEVIDLPEGQRPA